MRAVFHRGVVRRLLCGTACLAVAAAASAQTSTAQDDAVTTPPGQEIRLRVGHYTYAEPLPDTPISIHGPKLGSGYTATWLLSRRALWYVQGSAGINGGSTKYDGYCRNWLIRPNSGSPNGYALGLGAAFPCGEEGDADGYMEARALVGKDLLSRQWGLSPDGGIGLRYLANGIAGVNGFRTDRYLYVPLRLTARTRVAPRRVVSITGEYDVLLGGWQTTRQSKLGGGDFPASGTTPAFTINGFEDFQFPQHQGWALRASAQYPLTRHWFVEPSYIHWDVGASPVESAAVRFTINGVTATQQLGAYEPDNTTNEWFVSLGFRF